MIGKDFLNPLQTYFKKIDVKIEEVKKKTAQAGKPVICKQGCYWCCKEPVYCFKKEAINTLHKLNGEVLKRIKQRTREWAKRFIDSGLATNDEPPVVDYRKHNMWCPLLENGQCVVYDRRPAACRLHLAVGPLERCINDDARKEQLFASDPKATIRIQVDVASHCQPAQMDHLGVWLADLLLGQKIKTASRMDVSDVTEELNNDPNREQRMQGAVEAYIKQMKDKMNGVIVR
jgi:Fe-S-cluster containining protein